MAKKSVKKNSKKATKKNPKKKTTQSIESSDSNVKAFVATFLGIIGFVIALVAWKDDDYVMYYAKHSLVIFILAIAISIVNMFFGWIPFIGWGIMLILSVLLLIVWVVSWVYALSGERKQIPAITDFAMKFNF